MSVSESGGTLSDVAVLRWTGYGLAALSVAVSLVWLHWRDALWMIVLLAIAVVSLVVVLRAPEAFESLTRGGGRGFNFLAGFPAFLPGLYCMGVKFEDYTVPEAGAVVGAVVLLVAGMVALSRSVMASPVWFMMFAVPMGAATGYSALTILDVAYDTAPPATLSVPVLGKAVTVTHGRGGSTTYHLRVAPFGARKGVSNLTVSYATYAAHSAGGMVCLQEHSGAFGVPWVVLCGDRWSN